MIVLDQHNEIFRKHVPKQHVCRSSKWLLLLYKKRTMEPSQMKTDAVTNIIRLEGLKHYLAVSPMCVRLQIF